MTSLRARSVAWLAFAVHVSAFAQIPVETGKWELTGSFKGLPFSGPDERVRTACISEEALRTNPEKALMDAAPPPTDNASMTPPQCRYSDFRRDGTQSSWRLECVEPTIVGTGQATAKLGQVTLSETLELKGALGSRTIQHTVRARRLGTCS